jgi:PPOX class probable F420-dependent enzyme
MSTTGCPGRHRVERPHGNWELHCGPQMTPTQARARFEAERVARLATADAAGHPHVVPIVFALDEDVIYSAVDHKPKRSRALRRLANVAANPAVAVLVDHYDDDDWDRLWWARADGRGRLVAEGSQEEQRAVERLRDRYVAYIERPPAGPVLAVDVWRWSGWAATSAGPGTRLIGKGGGGELGPVANEAPPPPAPPGP